MTNRSPELECHMFTIILPEAIKLGLDLGRVPRFRFKASARIEIAIN